MIIPHSTAVIYYIHTHTLTGRVITTTSPPSNVLIVHLFSPLLTNFFIIVLRNSCFSVFLSSAARDDEGSPSIVGPVFFYFKSILHSLVDMDEKGPALT